MTPDHSNAPEAVNTSSAYKEAVPAPDAYLQPAPWHHSPQPQHPGQSRSDPLVCGLRQRNFLILCIAALVILGAAIGGGVGGGLAARKSSEAPAAPQQPASTSTSTSSSPSASASPSTSDPTKANPDCSRVDGKRRTTLDRWVFAFQCNRDIVGSRYDMMFLRGITSLDDCLFACARYNQNLNSNGCHGVVFSPVYSECAVKNSTSDAPSSVGDGRVLAILED